ASECGRAASDDADIERRSGGRSKGACERDQERRGGANGTAELRDCAERCGSGSVECSEQGRALVLHEGWHDGAVDVRPRELVAESGTGADSAWRPSGHQGLRTKCQIQLVE